MRVVARNTQHPEYANPNTKARVVLRACSQGCAPEQRKTRRRGKEREKRTENKEGRVVLDGGGARLADAATRHHLTQTQKRREKRRNSGEQNKHTRTQTIQKTSTRQSPSHGHHTLPSMRSKTPIHKQERTTQTQLRRSRPHNPSITRRNQPPRQRQSAMRQMQQQTRQRQARQRKSTPLPEKR